MANHLTVEKSAAHFRYKTLARAFLIALVCLSLVALSSYTAPKAQAEALTLTLTTAFLMLVIAVMSTLGVTLTAPSVDDGVDYLTDPFLAFLQGKGYSSISEYLASVGITAVSQLVVPVFGAINIVKNVYDVIAEFCTSFFASEGVTSGGSDVGEVAVSGIYSDGSFGNYSTQVDYYENSTSVSSSYSNGIYTITSSYSNPGVYQTPFITFRLPSTRPSTVSVRVNGVLSAQYVRLCSFASAPTSGTLYNKSQVAFREYSISSNAWTNIGLVYVSNATFLSIGISALKQGVTFQLMFDSNDPSKPAGFLISPSATVIDPPAVATGQTYSVPASGVDSTTAVETAINTAVAPLTTSAGLTQTGAAAGSAVTEGMEWLYEDTQAIRENTNPHFDFIPSTSGINIGIWHYVVDMFAAVAPAFALFGSFLSSLPPIVAILPFGSLALVFIVALIRRFTN